jgi:hypothetical protein
MNENFDLLLKDKQYTYKEICDLTGEKYNYGSSKKSQIKAWCKNYEIKKDKNYFTIIRKKTQKEIAEEDINQTYELLLKHIIYKVLLKSNGKTKLFTLNSMMRLSGFINQNYLMAKYNSESIEKMVESNFISTIDNETIYSEDIDNFIAKTEPNYRFKIKNILNKMADENIIAYNEYLYGVKCIHGYNHSFEPSEDEIKKFISIGYDILKNEIKVECKSDLTKEQRYYYNIRLMEEVRSKLHWNYYGYKYQIMSGTKILKEQLQYTYRELRTRINRKNIYGLNKGDNPKTFINWFIDENCDMCLKDKIEEYKSEE